MNINLSDTAVIQPTAFEYHNVHDEQHHQHDTQSNEEIAYGQAHQEAVSQNDELLTNENYPDDKHTHAYFKSSTETPYQSHEQYGHGQQYVTHAHVNTYRAPLVYHKLEQFYNPHEGYTHDDQEQYTANEGWCILVRYFLPVLSIYFKSNGINYSFWLLLLFFLLIYLFN